MQNITLAETRTLRAEQITPTVRVLNPLTRTFVVPSQTQDEKEYRVNLEHATCTCPDHRYRGTNCKHILAAQRYEQKNQAVAVAKPQYKTYAALFAALKI